MKIDVIGIRGFPNIQGGAEKHCEELYPRLARLGCEVRVFSRSSYLPKSDRPPAWGNVKLLYLWSPHRKNIETAFHSFLATLFSLTRRPDIVHYHGMGSALFLPLAKLFGLKTILTYHCVNYHHPKWSKFARLMLETGEKLGIKFSSRIIVISHVAARYLENKYGPEKLEFITNGVNLPDPVPAGETLKRFNLEAGNYVFSAGRFEPVKGLSDLIAAFRKLDHPDFKLVLAGAADHDNEYSRALRQAVESDDRIVLTGFMSGAPLKELFSNAGLFVLPSYSEGFPIALLEALSYGLSVLVSDIPPNREIPLDESRYFPPGDIGLLSSGMVELLKRKVTEEEKRDYRRFLVAHHDWAKIAAETYFLLRQVAGEITPEES
jgi:glycosyltransferase involved in cell wall biosynthesis